MATNELQARITADISGLESGLKKAQKLQDDYGKAISKTQNEIAQNIQISKGYEKAIEQLNNEFKSGKVSQKEYQKQLQRLQRDEKETTIDTANLRKELVRLKKDQKDLSASTGAVSKGMGQVGKSTANATPTVIEFSRVIQDAPYGIQGVANNIQQLTTNFGYLKKSAGGTIPALKAIGSSFLGPAGIVFAVSTITSLLVTYGDELLSSAGSTNKLAEATADFLGDAQAEIVTLRTLLAIAQDKSKSDQVRAQAVEEINDKYGDYLGNLTLEEIQTDAVNDSVNRLTRSLIKQAQVRGLEARIQEITSDNSEDLIDKQLELSDAYKDLGRQTRELLKDNAAFRDRIKEGLGTNELVDEINRVSKALNIPPPVGIVQAVGRVNELNKEVKSLKKETEQAINPIQELLSSVTADKLLLESQADINVDGVELTPKAQAERDAGLATRAKITGIDQSTLNSGVIEPIEVPITASTEGVSELTKELDSFDSRLARSIQTSKLFQDATTSAFSAFSQSITNDLNTGSAVLDAFISSLVGGLTTILSNLVTSQLAKSLVAKKEIATEQAKSTANAISIGTSAAAALGPAGILSAPGLIGSQVALVNGLFAPLYAFAQGGIVPGGSFVGDKVPALLNSGEMILNNSQQSRLFGMLNGGLNAGTNEASPLQIEGVIRGATIRLANVRAGKQNRRFSSGQ
jgi:DNA repair exonuclease SbcCD ATPase subunit